MQNRFIKIAAIAVIVLLFFYAAQYIATAIHHACLDPKEDCPPPIYLAGETFYRVVVHPPWLDKF